MKMSAYYENVSALLKCRRTIEILVSCRNVGALLKCWCTWNCWRSIEMLALFYNVGSLCNETYKNLHQLYKLTVSLLFGIKTPQGALSSALAGGSPLVYKM
jgi:hypothetical protein